MPAQHALRATAAPISLSPASLAAAAESDSVVAQVASCLGQIRREVTQFFDVIASHLAELEFLAELSKPLATWVA